MRNGWTPERRARQAELIRSWRPWERSTGPRTAEGKARASLNSYRGAKRAETRALVRALSALLGEQADDLKRMR
jgi:hypothetical protein